MYAPRIPHDRFLADWCLGRASTNFLPTGALVAQHFLDLELGGDTRMVGAGNPKRGLTTHTFVTNHQVFDGREQSMSGMQRSCDVWRWHTHGKGFSIRGGNLRLKPATLLPPLVDASLSFFKVEILRHRLGHGNP